MKLVICKQMHEGVLLAMTPICDGAHYLVCIGTAEEVDKMSLTEIVEARERAIARNGYEKLRHAARMN